MIRRLGTFNGKTIAIKACGRSVIGGLTYLNEALLELIPPSPLFNKHLTTLYRFLRDSMIFYLGEEGCGVEEVTCLF